jgi:hypothetical protein
MNRSGIFEEARRRRLGHWVALFVLAFNLLGGGLLPSAPMTIPAGGWVVCSSTGMVVVGKDGGQEQGGQEQDGHQPLCAFCLPLLQAGLVPDAAVVVDHVPPSEVGTAPASNQYHRFSSRAWTAGPSGPRAPPSL